MLWWLLTVLHWIMVWPIIARLPERRSLCMSVSCDATSWSAERRTVWWSDTGLSPGRIPCQRCRPGHHTGSGHWCAKPHLSLEYRAQVKLRSVTSTFTVNARLKRSASKPSMFSLLWTNIYQKCSSSLRNVIHHCNMLWIEIYSMFMMNAVVGHM